MLTKEVVKGNKRGVKPHINIKVCLPACRLAADSQQQQLYMCL